MPRILYGISPIGLGHATRSMVIIGNLQRAGIDVRIFSGGKAAEFLTKQGLKVDSIVSDATPEVADGTMKRSALWYLRSWSALRKTVKLTKRIFDEFSPDFVVCDEEFSGLLVAEERGIRRILITDELELGFGRTWLSRRIERRVTRWYLAVQASVDMVLVPGFGADSGRIRFVGPIVRSPAKTMKELQVEYGIPEGRVVLLSMSGSGIGEHLLRETKFAFRKAAVPGSILVVTGNRGRPVKGEGILDLGVVPDNQDLIAAADLVISTAGKSTIDEAAAAGTPLVVIPIKNHAEQERNAAELGYSFDDLKRLPELISSKIGRRETPRPFRGDEEASALILKALPRSSDESVD